MGKVLSFDGLLECDLHFWEKFETLIIFLLLTIQGVISLEFAFTVIKLKAEYAFHFGFCACV